MGCPSVAETGGSSGYDRREDVAALHQLLAYVDARRPELERGEAGAQRVANAHELARTLRTQLAVARGYVEK